MNRTCRRLFLKHASFAAAAAVVPCPAWAAEQEAPLTFGVVTDVHYADTETRGSRHYRDSLSKLTAAMEEFHHRDVAFVAELGDLINAGPSKKAELEYLEAVCKILKAVDAPKHFVLGNHCVDSLTKAEFLEACGRPAEPTYYSFDVRGYHFVVLDANFREDGTPYRAGNFHWTDTWIPQRQREWLRRDLANAEGLPTVVFIHQNLHDEKDPHGVKNAPEVRKVLESSGDVIAVFQGHMHSGGRVRIGGIPYITLRAMVEGPGLENNAFALVTLRGRNVGLKGFGRQLTDR